MDEDLLNSENNDQGERSSTAPDPANVPEMAWKTTNSSASPGDLPQNISQQLLCISFSADDASPQTHTGDPIFIDFSRGQQKIGSETSQGCDNVQDNFANSCNIFENMENLAGMSEDINFEMKLKVLEAVLPAPAKPKETTKTEKQFSCNQCSETFVNSNDRKAHYRKHAKINIWECNECGLKFKIQANFLQHRKENHQRERSFECTKCNLFFDRETQLRYHERRVHLQEKSQTCHFCGKGFFKRCELKLHLSIHLGIVKNICEICGKQFNHRSNMIRHTRLHSGIKPYVCCTCGLRFNQVSALQTHKKLKHPTGSKVAFSCTTCGKVLSSLAILKKHYKSVHKTTVVLKSDSVQQKNAPRSYYCTICGLSFSHIGQLQTHETEAHSKSDEFLCKSCNQKFVTPAEIKGHRCISQIRDDTKRDFLALQTDLLEGEDLLLHDNLSELPLTPPKTERISMKLPAIPSVPATPLACSKGDEDEREMVIHIQTVGQSEVVSVRVKYNVNSLMPAKEDLTEDGTTDGAEGNLQDVGARPAEPGEKSKKEAVSTEEEIELAKKYRCDECGKRFKKKHNYGQHMATHNIDLKKYSCPLCCQVYAWKTSLNKHIEIRHGKKTDNFLCNLCPKSFRRSQAFHEHVKRDHMGERPHKCSECGKTFFKRSDLNVHLRTHAKEKPYICGTCGKTFSHISHIIRHERIHSGVRPYACDMCEKTFVQSTTLNIHKKRIHEVGSTAKNSAQQKIESASNSKLESQSLTDTEPMLENLFEKYVLE